MRRHRAEALAVSLVFVLGLVLRLYQLGSYPPAEGYFIIDEPQRVDTLR